MAYKVDLDIYSGPLDLLLWLIQKEEVDIYDIPIARILDKYIEHIERSGRIDINNAAEFLVMASTLMEIKSRMLLPVEDRAAEEEEEGDPRAELVRQLLAYRAFKEAASRLSDLREIRARRYGRGGPVELPGEEKPAEPEPLGDVTLFDLADGYARLMKQTLGSGPRTIVYDEVSLQERMEAVMGALAVRPGFALPALFAGGADRIQIAGTFFALLELVRQSMVHIFQDADFGEIMIEKRRADGPVRAAGQDAYGAEARPAPPGPEPSLPPPVERRELPGGKRSRARARAHFAGIERPEGDDIAEESADDEFIGADDSELRLSRRIDRILRHAEEISERFEASRRGHRRPAEGEGASEGLDAAMAALEGDRESGEPSPAEDQAPDAQANATAPWSGPARDDVEDRQGPEGPPDEAAD